MYTKNHFKRDTKKALGQQGRFVGTWAKQTVVWSARPTLKTGVSRDVKAGVKTAGFIGKMIMYFGRLIIGR